MMQQMQTFPTTTDLYHQARCAGIGGNIGIGTGKHYKVHVGTTAFGVGNFNNYIHGGAGGDADLRGMTRIVFNGNGNNNRNDFHCGADNFQNCIASELIDNTGNYQLNFVNANNNNNGNMRYNMRQQMNPSFHNGDNQMQRCYIQRPQPQGQQARFVRIQGSKMRHNVTYRNFNNNQQRQKQNRRFNPKSGFNNYKTQKNGSGAVHATGIFEEEENGSSPNRSMQQEEYLGPPEKEVVRKNSTNHNKQESQQQQSKIKGFRSRSPAVMNSYYGNNRSNKACSSPSSGLLEPKVEYIGNAMHDLSYDDISENSDDNDDSDLRERLMRKKHDQIIKREPGELESDEDEVEAQIEKETATKRKSKKRSATDDTSKVFKSSGAASNEAKGKEHKKVIKSERKESEKQYEHDSYSGSSFTCHDNRCSPSRYDNKVSAKSKMSVHKSKFPAPNAFSSSANVDGITQNYYGPEPEVRELKEKLNDMKQSLREAQDKLLEANVVGSKKTLRMQEEIAQMKIQLEAAAKTENELKTTLKNVENELSAKKAELAKMSLMNEVEKQDKLKLNSEINRAYKERLTIEVEKLRALFDVEVAKMQAFYMSPNIYEDETHIPFTDVSSGGGGDLQNQNNHSPRNELLENPGNNVNSPETININHDTRDVNCNSHRELPFVQTYFNSGPQTSLSMTGTATTPFSLFENVMAYNSLIHHQHIYAQTSAAASSTNCAEASGSNVTTHSGI